MKKSFIAFLILIIGVFTSCSHSQIGQGTGGGDTVYLDNARHLTIVKYKGYTVVKLINPWKQGKTLHTYVLVPKGKAGDRVCKALPSLVGQAATIVRTPVRKSVVFSTVYCALLYELKADEAINGVCELQYISIPDVQKRARMKPTDARYIVDCGNSMGADIEKIIDLKPEVMLISPFENSGGYGKLESIHIPIIETADYMETSALGRAEWMKFYGLLYGREEEAFTLYNEVKDSYEKLKQKARKAKMALSVLTEKKTGSVW